MPRNHAIQVILKNAIDFLCGQPVDDKLQGFALKAVLFQHLDVVLQMEHAFAAAFVRQFEHGIGGEIRR